MATPKKKLFIMPFGGPLGDKGQAGYATANAALAPVPPSGVTSPLFFFFLLLAGRRSSGSSPFFGFFREMAA